MTLPEDLLYLDSTVPIGSIALDVATEESDLDLCVLSADLDKSMIERLDKAKTKIANMEYYDSVLLLESSLYKLDDTDVFIFTDENKLAIVHKVMYLMERYPKFLLRMKWFRVKLFRYLLIKNGFKNEQPTRPTTGETPFDL